MEKPISNYWQLRLGNLKEALEANNFEAFIAQNAREAGRLVMDKLVPKIAPKSISWGGSMTFVASELYDMLKAYKNADILDTFDKSLSPEESLERRRQSLLVDLFVTGSNAVTRSGELVNLDMIGNRVAGITFGPKNVVVMVGRNKIVEDLDAAIERIKDYAAPVNVMRLGKKAPCAKTGECEECKSPERICNSWTITQKSFPKGRIKVVLINENLGL
ncbi:MAG: lactate utilization protein [Deltaproteobacteria bacterium]|nr:lactate utilization protein [Deltaproteobacteria bacterium]